MTRPLSVSALAWAIAPASVTGALPPAMMPETYTHGMPCSAQKRSFSVPIVVCGEGREGLAVEHQERLGSRRAASPPATTRAISQDRPHVAVVVGGEDDGLARGLHHGVELVDEDVGGAARRWGCPCS